MEAKLNRRELCQLMTGAAAAEVIGMSARRGWGQTGTNWPSPDEAKQIAQEAYVYAFPIVQNYLSIMPKPEVLSGAWKAPQISTSGPA